MEKIVEEGEPSLEELARRSGLVVEDIERPAEKLSRKVDLSHLEEVSGEQPYFSLEQRQEIRARALARIANAAAEGRTVY